MAILDPLQGAGDLIGCFLGLVPREHATYILTICVLQVNIFGYDKHIPEIAARFDVIFKLKTVGVWAFNGKRFVLTGKIL